MLGDVVGDEFAGVDLLSDLSLTYTIEGASGVYQANVVVPEPAALAMLASGLLGLLCLFRRQRSGVA